LVPFRVRVTHGGLVSVWTVAKKKKKTQGVTEGIGTIKPKSWVDSWSSKSF
jgi:hypothetical protein